MFLLAPALRGKAVDEEDADEKPHADDDEDEARRKMKKMMKKVFKMMKMKMLGPPSRLQPAEHGTGLPHCGRQTPAKGPDLFLLMC